MPLFKRRSQESPAEPVNDSAIRVASAELAAAKTHLHNASAILQDVYTVAHAEMMKSDPTSAAGKELEQITLQLCRVSGQLAVSANIEMCVQAMRNFNIAPAPAETCTAIVHLRPAEARA